MRWQDFRRSDNVEEVQGGSSGGFGGGGMRLSGGAVILVVVVSLLLGKNPLEILSLLDGGSPPVSVPAPAPQQGQMQGPAPQARRPETDFVRAIVGDTEDFWASTFKQAGRAYQPAKVTEFNGGLRTECGPASAATGPFYCPLDKHVYLDLGFFQELSQRFGAPGEFARAYVIAHEIGHHVQDELGRLEKAQASGQSRGPTSNSVRLELQADCYAGVWGHSAAQRGKLDTSDIEQGLAAAAAVGDDRLQRQQRGYVAPESFSHGSSAQRVRWFKIGLDSGDVRQCNTFAAREL